MVLFYKAQGLGNDFVIFEAPQNLLLSPGLIQRIADRKRGVGCDQVIIYNKISATEYSVRFYNSDGSEVSSCGNGSRALGKLLFDQEKPSDQMLTFHTKGGLLSVYKQAGNLIQIILPAPKFHWNDIPQRYEDLHELPIQEGQVSPYYTINVGNPHLVAFFENLSLIDIRTTGLFLEHHPLFPERINVSFVEVKDKHRLKLEVWERGSGFTGACGTAACATAVLATQHKLTHGPVIVEQSGGDLLIEWQENRSILMTGPAVIVFRGELDFSSLGIGENEYPKSS